MTDDLISREQLIKVITGDSFKSDFPRMSKALVTIIKALPPVNLQEPKTGHWIDREVYDADRWECSECGRTEPYKENYCPKCGCRMFEPQESEDNE